MHWLTKLTIPGTRPLPLDMAGSRKQCHKNSVSFCPSLNSDFFRAVFILKHKLSMK